MCKISIRSAIKARQHCSRCTINCKLSTTCNRLCKIKSACNNNSGVPCRYDMSNKVALINMPWSTIRQGSLALAILKRVLRRHRIASDTFYFNLHLASRMNLRIYENVSSIFLVGDWLFSQHLFGEFGSQKIHNSLADSLS